MVPKTTEINKTLEFIPKRELCVFCGLRRATRVCDFETGQTFSRNYNEIRTKPKCFRKMCNECSTKIMYDRDICPYCVEILKKQLGGLNDN